MPVFYAKSRILNGISREGMVIRCLAVYSVPEAYAELCAERRRNGPESIDHSVCLNRIEGRILLGLCKFASLYNLKHISPQYDGAGISIDPSPRFGSRVLGDLRNGSDFARFQLPIPRRGYPGKLASRRVRAAIDNVNRLDLPRSPKKSRGQPAPGTRRNPTERRGTVKWRNYE